MNKKIFSVVVAFVLIIVAFGGVANASVPGISVYNVLQKSASFTITGLELTPGSNISRYTLVADGGNYGKNSLPIHPSDISSNGTADLTLVKLISNAPYEAYIVDNNTKNNQLAVSQMVPFKTLEQSLIPFNNEHFKANPIDTSVDINFTGLEKENVQYEVELTDINKKNISTKDITATDIDNDGNAKISFTNLSPNTDYAIWLRKLTKSIDDGSYIYGDKVRSLTFTTKVSSTQQAKIASFSPTVGEAGDTVTINGENFTGVDKVLFGSIDVGLKFKAVSPTQITATVPAGIVDGKITVKTEKNGDAVSDNNFTTVKNLALSYSDVTATSVKLNVSGFLSKGDYLFYIYNEDTYPNGDPAVPFKEYTNSSDSQGLSLTISGLTSNHDYVGVLDKGGTGWGVIQNAPEPVHFTTLSDSTDMNNITPSNTATPTPASDTPTPTPTPAVTSTPNSGIVPDCGKVVTSIGADGKEVVTMANPCTFKDLIQLVNNVIKFLLFDIATPLIALILMYTGYLYLTAGGSSSQTEKVRHILFNAVIGYVVALAAWLIVKTILSSLNIDPSIETFLK